MYYSFTESEKVALKIINDSADTSMVMPRVLGGGYDNMLGAVCGPDVLRICKKAMYSTLSKIYLRSRLCGTFGLGRLEDTFDQVRSVVIDSFCLGDMGNAKNRRLFQKLVQGKTVVVLVEIMPNFCDAGDLNMPAYTSTE